MGAEAGTLSDLSLPLSLSNTAVEVSFASEAMVWRSNYKRGTLGTKWVFYTIQENGDIPVPRPDSTDWDHVLKEVTRVALSHRDILNIVNIIRSHQGYTLPVIEYPYYNKMNSFNHEENLN